MKGLNCQLDDVILRKDYYNKETQTAKSETRKLCQKLDTRQIKAKTEQNKIDKAKRKKLYKKKSSKKKAKYDKMTTLPHHRTLVVVDRTQLVSPPAEKVMAKDVYYKTKTMIFCHQLQK